MKDIYPVSPFLIGSRAKSLAIIIPIEVARAFNITNSSILALKADAQSRMITLQELNTEGPIQHAIH